jgi:hypothetical protein
MCLLAGGSPQAVSLPPSMGGAADGRMDDCAVEYAKADRAVQWLVDSYGRGPADPPGEPVQIIYEATRTQMQNRLLAKIRERRLGELTVAALTARFSLSRPLRIVMRVCQRPTAIWNPEAGELVLCYDLLDAFYQIYKIGQRTQ